MAVNHSTKQKNGTCDGTAPVGGTTYNSGLINVYSGSAPASADAAETGTKLSANTMNATAFPAPVGGVLTANAIASSTILATGTAGYARMVASTDTGALVTTTQPRVQFGVATSGAEMTVNTTSFVAAGTLTISALSYTHPN